MRGLLEASSAADGAAKALTEVSDRRLLDWSGAEEPFMSAQLHSVRAMLDAALLRFKPTSVLRHDVTQRVEAAALRRAEFAWAGKVADAMRALDEALQMLPPPMLDGPRKLRSFVSTDPEDE